MTLPHGLTDRLLEKKILGDHASMHTLCTVLTSEDSSTSIEYAEILVEVQGKVDQCTRSLPVAGMLAYAGAYTTKPCQPENSGTYLRIWTPAWDNYDHNGRYCRILSWRERERKDFKVDVESWGVDTLSQECLSFLVTGLLHRVAIVYRLSKFTYHI